MMFEFLLALHNGPLRGKGSFTRKRFSCHVLLIIMCHMITINSFKIFCFYGKYLFLLSE